MSFVANSQFSLIPYKDIRPKTDSAVKTLFISLGIDDFSEATLEYFKLYEPLWQNEFTLALADNTHDLDEDFTDCERSGADRETKFWSKFAFTMAVAGGFNPGGDINSISAPISPLNYLQTNCSYLNRIPRAQLSDENYCTLGAMHDAIGNGQGDFYIISLPTPDDPISMGDACTDLSRLLSGFSTDGMGIPVIIDTSKSFTKMVEAFNKREGVKQSEQFCYMRTAASIADPSTTPAVKNMIEKFGLNNIYCEHLDGGRVVAADDLVGNVQITYTDLQFNSILSKDRDQVTATYTITGGPLADKFEERILVANTGPKHVNSINYVKGEFLNAQRGAAGNDLFVYPGKLFSTQILEGRAKFYDEFNAMLNGAKASDAVKNLMKTYTMGCARKRTSDAAQGDDCDKLPSLKFHKLNLDGKSLNTEGDGVKMAQKGVLVTIDRLLFARQLTKCPDAAAILDSGTHMIVYIPGGGVVKAAVKVATEEVATKEAATIEKEKAPLKRSEPLTPAEKTAINNKLREERRFRRGAIAAAAAIAKSKAKAEEQTKTTPEEKEGDAEEEKKKEADVENGWFNFFKVFFAAIAPAGSGEGGGANARESQSDGLYQTGGDPPTADDLDLFTILSYLYGRIDRRTDFYSIFTKIIDQIRGLFGEGLITFRYYNDQTHNAVYVCNSDRDEYIDSYLDGLRAADSVDPFGTGKVGKTHYKTEAEVIFHIVYWNGGTSPTADFSIVRYNNKTNGPSIRCVGGGWDNWVNPSLKTDVTLQAIFAQANGGEELSAAEFLTSDPSDVAPSPGASEGASDPDKAPMGGGASPSITAIFRAPFEKLSSAENLSETNIAVMNSLLNILCNYETSFINYREGRDAFYNIINDGFPLKMLPNIVMASSVEVYVFVKLMLDDYTADRAKTINYGLFEYYLYSQKDKNYIYMCLQDIKDYILGANMYYISPTETDIIPPETQSYFEDLCARTVTMSGQIYLQTYDLTNTGDYEAIYQLASDNYLTMGGFHGLSEIFMTKTGEILQALPSEVLAKYGEQVTEAVEESKKEEKADVGKGIGYFLPRGPANRVITGRMPLVAGGATTNLKKSIKKHRTRKLTRGKKRDTGKKHTRKRGIKRRHHTKRHL